MDCYINGAGIISPQKTYDNGEFLPELTEYDNNVLTCVLPNFKGYLNPFQMRRLSRMLRMGLSAATICLRDAGVKTPDAIITATGYGFQENMGKFLTEILSRTSSNSRRPISCRAPTMPCPVSSPCSVSARGTTTPTPAEGFALETACMTP